MPKRKSVTFTKRKRHSLEQPQRAVKTSKASHRATAKAAKKPARAQIRKTGKSTIIVESDQEDQSDSPPQESGKQASKKGKRTAEDGSFSRVSTTQRKRQRLSSPTGDDGEADHERSGEIEDELSQPRKFPILKPHRRFVRQDTIKEKWQTLPPLAQSRVRALFASVERPLLTKASRDRALADNAKGKRTTKLEKKTKLERRQELEEQEVQLVLDLVTQTLARRLPRFPFPPDVKDWHFDHEAILRANRVLEQQYTSAWHSIELLRLEIAKEEEALVKDQDELKKVKANAAKEEALHNRQLANLHELLRNEPEAEDLEDGPEQIMLSPGSANKATPGPMEVEHEPFELDPSLFAPLVAQLGDHLRNIKGNTAQVAGVEEQITKTTAKLDALLYERLPREIYEKLPQV